ARAARAPDTKPRAESRSCGFSLFLFLKARAERAPCTSSRQIRAKRGGTLFFRLGGELQRIALAPAGFRSARGLRLGDVPGVDGDHAYPAPMGRHHHAIGLIL